MASTTFDDLPLPVHSLILTYVSASPDCSSTTSGYNFSPGQPKPEFYNNVKNCEAITHTWRDLIQAKIWSDMFVGPFEIPQLREFLMANPALATYIRTLRIRQTRRGTCDPPPAPSSIPFDEASGDTKEGLRIAQIWSEVLELIQTHLHQHWRFERLIVDVDLGLGVRNRLVEFPVGYTIPVQSGIKVFELAMPMADRGDRLGMESVRWMVEGVGGGVEELSLELSDWELGEREIRREIYRGLTHLATHLLRLTPNLTSLHLRYTPFIPNNNSETRIYPYTHLDNNADLLSRALRVLSKQLVTFTYLGGRISPELFLPSTTTTESTEWPHLKRYTVYFSRISSSGTWLFTFPAPSTYTFEDPLPPPTPLLPLSDDKMSATDPEYVDPIGYNYDAPHRDIPVRELIDELFETASRAMVPCMPVIQHWELTPTGGVNMGLTFDYDETGRGRITTGRAYAHSSETMRVWSERFRGLVLVKVENAGMCGVECMDEEDQRTWRGG